MVNGSTLRHPLNRLSPKAFSQFQSEEGLTILSGSSEIRAFISNAPKHELFSETMEYRRLEDF
jgi:hypothetical protein